MDDDDDVDGDDVDGVVPPLPNFLPVFHHDALRTTTTPVLPRRYLGRADDANDTSLAEDAIVPRVAVAVVIVIPRARASDVRARAFSRVHPTHYTINPFVFIYLYLNS